MKKAPLSTIRHSCSHILALAVKNLYPQVKFGIGPAIKTGFYYDFQFPQPISQNDFAKIEKEMEKLIKKKLKFTHRQVSIPKAKKIFSNQPYKLDLIKELEKQGNQNVSLYQIGNFVDLCKGPHVKNTSQIKAFKLLSLAGAYWQGDEKNPMLTRIYGTCFNSKAELENYLQQQQQAKKRDHRQLGKDLELFTFDEEFGSGLVLWLPKGAILRKQIMDFALQTYLDHGYQLVTTPHLARLSLWKKSGHWDFYRERMYSPMKMEKEEYVVKPMNCPGHVKIYQSKLRSYKDLPLRYTEMGTVYRWEESGVLHGLTRVRGFTQDDAHIFCTPQQLQSEIIQIIDLTTYILAVFNFKNFEVSLSVREPQAKKKYLGDEKHWQLAEKALEEALKRKKLKFKRYPGEAVFYGPKIDFLVEDAIGRQWQLTTIQVDFNFPKRFNLFYIDKNGKKKTPIMLHRALLGSLERFTGILIEHYAGAFPVWLSPVQTLIIPVSERHLDYAKNVNQKLQKEKIRSEIDQRPERVEYKIREAELQKIPYILVVGDKEKKSQAVSVRQRGSKKLTKMKIKEFLGKILKERERKV